MRVKFLCLLATVILLAAACSSGKPPSSESGNANAATCKIDAVKICDQAKDIHASTDPTGYSDSESQIEQNGPRTESWFYTFTTPNQTTLQVQCELNMQHHKVVYAHAMSGPALSDSDVGYLRSQGLCLEN